MQSGTERRRHLGIPFLLASLSCVVMTGCEAKYSSLRFRPVDTTSQMVLEGVRITVSRNNAQPVEQAISNEHGHAELNDLRAGDILTFSKQGYETAVLTLNISAYTQKSPANTNHPARFDLRDLDAVPIPLHRAGHVVRP